MANFRYGDRARMGSVTTGTGTITLGSAMAGHQTFAAAGIVDTNVVPYVIEDGADWEIGYGTYTAAGTTLSRTLISSSTGSLLSLSGAEEAYIAPRADFFNVSTTPVTKTVNFSLASTENWVICNQAGITTVTLPAASAWNGRQVTIKTIQAQTVISASANVCPIDTATPGTAILAATAGKWAKLVSDGTNWIIMEAN